MLRKPRIILFGGSGFLGHDFSMEGYKIIRLKCDILDKGSFKHTLCEGDIVINLVGLNPVFGGDFSGVHIVGMQNLISVCKEVKVKKLIYLSAYGKGKSKYFESKKFAEKLLKESGLNYSIIRPSFIEDEKNKVNLILKKLGYFVPSSKVKIYPVKKSIVHERIRLCVSSDVKEINCLGKEVDLGEYLYKISKKQHFIVFMFPVKILYLFDYFGFSFKGNL